MRYISKLIAATALMTAVVGGAGPVAHADDAIYTKPVVDPICVFVWTSSGYVFVCVVPKATG